MKKVLIVDDDKEYAKFVESILIDDCEVDHIECRSDLLDKCTAGSLRKYSLILFDLYIGDDNGITLYQKVKSILGDQMPLSMLISERASEDQRLKAFETYFFGYIDKDYNADEIKLRILNALYYSKELNVHLVESGLCFNLERKIVNIDGEDFKLTQIEFKILFNCSSEPVGFPKDLLTQKVWDDRSVSNQTLNVHIHNLNKKIQSSGRKVSITSNGLVNLRAINQNSDH
jgi:DNA-binding response OmpR family regulator